MYILRAFLHSTCTPNFACNNRNVTCSPDPAQYDMGVACDSRTLLRASKAREGERLGVGDNADRWQILKFKPLPRFPSYPCTLLPRERERKKRQHDTPADVQETKGSGNAAGRESPSSIKPAACRNHHRSCGSRSMARVWRQHGHAI